MPFSLLVAICSAIARKHATNRAPGSNLYTRSQRARDGPLSGSCSSCGCASRAASSSPTAPKAHTSYSSHNKTSTKSLSLSSINVDELRPRTLYFTEEPFFLCFPLRVDHLGHSQKTMTLMRGAAKPNEARESKVYVRPADGLVPHVRHHTVFDLAAYLGPRHLRMLLQRLLRLLRFAGLLRLLVRPRLSNNSYWSNAGS